MFKKIVAALLLATTIAGTASAKDYKASLFGVKSDGVTVNTRSIQKAIDFISEQGGGKLVFYVGRYLTGTVELKSNVTIQIEEGAALVAIPSVYDYNNVEGNSAVIVANGCKNIEVCGKGLIEGNAAAISESVEAQISKGHLQGAADKYAPATILFNNCEDAKVSGIIINESCDAAIILSESKNVDIQNVTVNNVTSSAEAIKLLNCTNVKVKDCYFDTKGEAVNSKQNSSGVEFSNCVKPNGTKVSSSK